MTGRRITPMRAHAQGHAQREVPRLEAGEGAW